MSSEANKREEAVLKFWQENKIFSKTLSESKGRKEFIFYEGPPTANAKPALHHLEARAFKDAIPRYKTMRGYHVRRKAGWDTHGLPVELQVEKKLGLNSKKAIEEYGIAKFNKECRDSVWEYVGDWDKFTKRIGFWVDQENAYVTYHNDYIESVWNILKEVEQKKLLYKDYKVVPWCPRCGTALSSHELAQGYQDDRDLAVTVKFKVKSEKWKDTFILAWTTTPWTLPGNLALAVGEKIKYVKVKTGEEFYILAKDRLAILENYEIVEELSAKDLVGLSYEPLYPFFADISKADMSKAYKVYLADFVNTEDGTGVVHTAVMYGQDDFVLGTKVGLPKFHLVNPEGKFIKGTGFLENRFVKDEEVAVDIIKDLAHRGLLFKKEKYEHSYPHCWRCKTPLIYYARDSWYIKMSDPVVKNKLIAENKKIAWEPEHTREGRFGEWLRDLKDWAISRERYWGTPLPAWICQSCGERRLVGSLEELKKNTKKSGNKYFVMRHGESEHNVQHIYSSDQKKYHLTEKGREQVLKTAKELKNKKITQIISSPFLRTRESAQLVAREIGFPQEKIVYDDRIRELEFGDFSERPSQDYWDFMKDKDWQFDTKVPGGESFQDGKNRIGEFLYSSDQKNQNENILVVSHGLAVEMFPAVIEGADKKHSLEIFHQLLTNKPAGLHKEHEFVPLPHNEDYELDFHRPYIDEIVLKCECGGDMLRTKEVMDVWFDSGAMPFAQDHYPFENKKWVEGKGYPADYISEAIDQTRGWFYTLHAVGILMGRGKAFKNVICLGHLLDAQGKKMSKSVGNIVDPWEMIEKYGVDTLRLWMYSVNQPGESKNFDEKTVQLLHQQVFGLLYNVLAFYELYRDKKVEDFSQYDGASTWRKSNILDQWIVHRLYELNKLTHEHLDNYKLLEPVRAMKDFVGDLSTWYLRRSRERIKEGDTAAKSTLYYVLKTLAQIMAPFAPFAAEDIWLKLKNSRDEESVHLSSYPMWAKVNSDILKNMRTTREIVSQGLEARQKAGIQVRQPLNELKVKSVKLESEYLDLIKDELNLKNISFGDEFELDTNITPALKAEGEYREFMRTLQDKRKELGLKPGDKMPLTIEQVYKKYKIPNGLQEHMLRVAAVGVLISDNFDGALPKDEIVAACLLHDMGNILKFDMNINKLPKLLEPEGKEYWRGVQDEFRKKYGENEHGATIKIAEELQVSKQVIELINAVSYEEATKNVQGGNYGKKIMEYCDNRADPFGIVSLEDRLKDFRTRYAHRIKDERQTMFENTMREIEKQIFAKCKIKPEDINDQTAAPIISELKNFVIK